MQAYETITWKEIPNYVDYFASKNGLIKTPKRVTTGSRSKAGYMVLRIKDKIYYVHRLIAQTFLENPDNKTQVNHINRIRSDNRLENIEWNTPAENHLNLSKQANTSSTFIGVTWYKRTQKWMVQLQVDKNRFHIGYFTDEQQAARAYDKVAVTYKVKHLNFPIQHA